MTASDLDTIVTAHLSAADRAAYERGTAIAATMGRLGRFVSMIVRDWLAIPMINRARRGRMARELEGLSDHMLADIGLHRSGIPALVLDAYPLSPRREKAQGSAEIHRLERTRPAEVVPADEDHHPLAA